MWAPTGGMGGGLPPDDVTHCLRTGTRSCCIAEQGRFAGLREMFKLARENAHIFEYAEGVFTIEWMLVRNELNDRLYPEGVAYGKD